MTSSVLEVEHLSKTFGGTRALADFSITVERGEIHGLVGRNGSGKSTLIKVLSGYHAPDKDGALVRVGGAELSMPVLPGEPSRHGLSFVQQDLGLASDLTVRENVKAGHYHQRVLSPIRRSDETKVVAGALARVGLDPIVDMKVNALAPAERSLVALARALLEASAHPGSGVLVLDEPTSQLPNHEVQRIFEAIRRISQEGTSVLFVTHRLSEILALTDRVTVIRDGRRAATLATSETTESDLVELILGRRLEDLYPEQQSTHRTLAVELEGVSSEGLNAVNMHLAAGEIVGATGLAGMGQDTLPYVLFGALPATGRLRLGDDAVDLAHLTPRRAIDLGIGLLPADRQGKSGLVDFTVRENLSLPDLDRYFTAGWLDVKRERATIDRILNQFHVEPAETERLLGELSGGNQQKALLGKWFQLQPRLLLLHEPTQGVDIGAKKEIFRQIQDIAKAGQSVLIASSEYEDIAHVCHRVVVFGEGRVMSELSGPTLSEERIVEHCYRAIATS